MTRVNKDANLRHDFAYKNIRKLSYWKCVFFMHMNYKQSNFDCFLFPFPFQQKEHELDWKTIWAIFKWQKKLGCY